jgi:hypothetical protein
MRIRILATSGKKDKHYEGREFTITSGYKYLGTFNYTDPTTMPLEKAEWYKANDVTEYTLLDVRRKFARTIAERKTGVLDMVLGIQTDKRLPMIYTDRIEIISYDESSTPE